MDQSRKHIKTKNVVAFILFLSFISVLNLEAQEFKFGAQAGLVVANAQWTGADMPDVQGVSLVYSPMLSYGVNGYIGYKSSGFWGVSAEPGFIQKGGLQKNNKDNKEDDVRFQLNYIHMPLLANLYITDKLFFSIGPELAYMISAKGKGKDKTVDIENFYDNEFEFSGLVGISYTFFERIDLGLRYNHGITYTAKIPWTDEVGNSLGESKEYNRYFQFLVRFYIL